MNTKYLLAYCFCVLLLALGFAFPGGADAMVIRTGNQATVAKGETINETLLIAGQSITVDGDVKGDIICAGQNIDINGAVEGDIICVGQNITVANSVSGSVRAAGQMLKIDGSVGRNVTAAGQTISTGSSVAGEMIFAAQHAAIDGKIGKNIAGAANSIIVGGQIAGNADFRDSSLILRDGGQIAGVLNYSSDNEFSGQSSQVLGGINRTIPQPKESLISTKPQKTIEHKIGDKIASLVFNLALALALVFFFKNFIQKFSGLLLEKPGRSLGWGFVILIMVPMVSVLLMFTIIGIPVAIAAILVYLAAMYLVRVVAAIAVGRKIAQIYWKSKQDSRYVPAVLGIIVMWILFAIPLIGPILSFFAIVWGLGGARLSRKINKLLPTD
jgi:hypothetical protein